MNGILTQKNWETCLKDYEITDIAIREHNIIYLCARKAMSYDEASRLFDSQIPSRLIGVYPDDDPSENFGVQEIEGMNLPIVGVSRSPFPRESGLLASRDKDGDVWPMGGGSNGPMEHIAPGKWPHPHRLKCINGFTYSVSSGRDIYKRVEVGNWIPFQDGFPDSNEEIWPGFSKMSTSKQLDLSATLGFNDMDAFSESDMYAVGGHGDVWHFDGTQWQKMGFPSNVQLATVTCAGDGNVYISGEGGSLWVGEKSTWKSIHKGNSSIMWNDVLWFENKLWLASDYQFRIWNGNELESVTHNGEQVFINGNMDVYDGILAIASLNTVMTFNGQEWRTIVAPYLS